MPRINGSGKNCDRLVDLMLKDKVLSSCNQDLEVFFQERIPEDTEMMTHLGQTFFDSKP